LALIRRGDRKLIKISFMHWKELFRSLRYCHSIFCGCFELYGVEMAQLPTLVVRDVHRQRSESVRVYEQLNHVKAISLLVLIMLSRVSQARVEMNVCRSLTEVADPCYMITLTNFDDSDLNKYWLRKGRERSRMKQKDSCVVSGKKAGFVGAQCWSRAISRLLCQRRKTTPQG
jgi:hypothetical protein